MTVMPLLAQETVSNFEKIAGDEQPADNVAQVEDAAQDEDTELDGVPDQAATEAVNIEVVVDSTQTGYYLFYDLPGDDTEAMYEVIFKVTEDGGETYDFPSDVSGDIGRGIITGERKRIHWEIQSDIEDAVTEKTEITIETRRIAEEETGTISVHGNPSEADIYINDKKIGAAPIENKALPAGTYMLRVSHAEYEDYTGIITVTGGKNTIERYSLKSLSGSITVEGFPDGSEVFLNNELLGKTPIFNMEVPGGINKVVIKGNGNEDYETTVNISGAGDTIHTYTIIPLKKTEISAPKPSLISRKQAVKKSLLIPGRGQRYMGHRKKGNILTALQIATLGGYIAAYLKASSAEDDYDDARTAYKIADTPSDIEAAWETLKSKHDSADSASGLVRFALSSAAAVYLWNVIDAALISKYQEETPKKHSLQLTPFLDGDCNGISASMRF